MPYPPAPAPPPDCGCAYLQAISEQIASGGYPTTGGDYLETIFTHREALFAYPPAHRACALGFSALARAIEERSWARKDLEEAAEWHGAPSVTIMPRPDWDGDNEAVAAFRHEAWVIANL